MFVIEFGFIDQRLDIFLSDLNITKKNNNRKPFIFMIFKFQNILRRGEGRGGGYYSTYLHNVAYIQYHFRVTIVNLNRYPQLFPR